MSKRETTCVLIAIVIVVVIAGVEAKYAEGLFSGLILIAAGTTGLVFMMARNPRDPQVINLANYPGQDVLADSSRDEFEAKTPFGSGKFKGKHLLERLLGDRTVTLMLICAVAWYMWLHHTESAELMRKNTEAILESNYISTLPQSKKEELNLAMPDSLRRKLRRE